MAQFVVNNTCNICGKELNKNDTAIVVKKATLVKYGSLDRRAVTIKDNEFRVIWHPSKKDTKAFHEECINNVIKSAIVGKESKERLDQIVNELKCISKDNNEGFMIIEIE